MVNTEVIIAIISSILTSIVGPLAVHYATRKSNKNEDPIKESLETNMLVTHKIEEIKDEYGADRVWISQFHNGGHFYPTGKSIQKFSIGYEVVNSGITSIQSNFQNIPISLFSKYMNELLENNIICIPNYTNDNIDTYGLKYIASEMGCKSTYLFALKSIEGRFIGVLGIEYVQDEKELNSVEIDAINNKVALICGTLVYLLNSKK